MFLDFVTRHSEQEESKEPQSAVSLLHTRSSDSSAVEAGDAEITGDESLGVEVFGDWERFQEFM